MVSTSDVPQLKTVSALPAEQCLTLHNISWDAYEKLLEAFGEHRVVRLHYF